MNCETLQRAIDERRPGDTAVLPGDLAAHLAGCPACQAYAAGVAAIGRALAHCRDLTASLPEAELLDARERIAEAVAARRAVAAVRRRPSFPAPADPLLVWGMGLAVLLLAAFIGVLAWPRSQRTGTLNAQRSTPNAQVPSAFSVERSAFNVLPPDPAAGQPAATPPDPAPESTKLATKLATKIEEPELTGLPAFWAEYEALKASSKGISPGFLQRFARYLEGPSRTLDERFQGWELLCEACEEAGDLNRSVQAYGRYLDIVENQEGSARAMAVGKRRADRLFNIARDRMYALAHYDLLASRYPDTDLPSLARHRCGEYCQENKQWREAEQIYRAIIEADADGKWVLEARKGLWQVLAVQKRTDEAVAVLDEIAQTRADERPYADFYAGQVLIQRGLARYPEAVRRLKRAQATAPDSPYADYAGGLLTSISRQAVVGL